MTTPHEKLQSDEVFFNTPDMEAVLRAIPKSPMRLSEIYGEDEWKYEPEDTATPERSLTRHGRQAQVDSARVLGIIDQDKWCRLTDELGKR